MADTAPLGFFERLIFAWVVYFKVLFDGAYAAEVKNGPRALPEPTREEEKPKKEAPKKKAEPEVDPLASALQLLALLQREGRLVDFLEEDVASFSDADIGAAARVVHTGCRKALREHVTLEPVRTEEEGAKVTLESDFAKEAVKLTGNVGGQGPWSGTLRHRGWRAAKLSLPTAISGHDVRILAQAEVEL